MMLDSGASALMKPYGYRLIHSKRHTTEITFADDSIVSSETVGVRPVQWTADGVNRTMNLSKKLFVPDMTTSLLSVLALIIKNKVPAASK